MGNENSNFFKCFYCYEEVKEDYLLKKHAYDFEIDETKRQVIGDSLEEIIKKFRIKTIGSTSSNLIRHLRLHHEDLYVEYKGLEEGGKVKLRFNRLTSQNCKSIKRVHL